MTSKLKNLSTTAASNNATPPDGFPEGMAPSTVNNSMRELMARLREWYEGAEWINLGHTINSASSNQIVLAGDVSAFYTVGRAVRADGTVGYVTACSVSTNTTVTVSGITFSGAPTTWEVGILQTSIIRAPGNFAVAGALTLAGTIPQISITGDGTAAGVNFDGHSNVALSFALGGTAQPKLIYAAGAFGATGLVDSSAGYNLSNATNSATGVYSLALASGSWSAGMMAIAIPFGTTASYATIAGTGTSARVVHVFDSAGAPVQSSFVVAVLKLS